MQSGIQLNPQFFINYFHKMPYIVCGNGICLLLAGTTAIVSKTHIVHFNSTFMRSSQVFPLWLVCFRMICTWAWMYTKLFLSIDVATWNRRTNVTAMKCARSYSKKKSQFFSQMKSWLLCRESNWSSCTKIVINCEFLFKI